MRTSSNAVPGSAEGPCYQYGYVPLLGITVDSTFDSTFHFLARRAGEPGCSAGIHSEASNRPLDRVGIRSRPGRRERLTLAGRDSQVRAQRAEA